MIFRVEKTKGFTVMSNYHLRDKNLSLKAKGLLSVVFSLPADWDYSIKGLEKICKEGKASIGTALKELEQFKYLERERTFDEKGRIVGFQYVFFEFPQGLYTENRVMDEEPCTDFQDMENPYPENPDMENQPHLNTNKIITNKQSTNILSTDVDAGDQESHPVGEQQQQPTKYIFVGPEVNVRVEVSWYERFKATYPYYSLVVNELSNYKKKNGITAHVKDESYLTDWAETDKERFEYQFSLQNTCSFDANDFFQAALRHSYRRHNTEG